MRKRCVLLELTPAEAESLLGWLNYLDAGPTDYENESPKGAEHCRDVGRQLRAVSGTLVPSLEDIAATTMQAAAGILEHACSCVGGNNHGKDCSGRIHSKAVYALADTLKKRASDFF